LTGQFQNPQDANPPSLTGVRPELMQEKVLTLPTSAALPSGNGISPRLGLAFGGDRGIVPPLDLGGIEHKSFCPPRAGYHQKQRFFRSPTPTVVILEGMQPGDKI